MTREPLNVPDEINSAPGQAFYSERTEAFFNACKTCGGTCRMPRNTEGTYIERIGLDPCPDCWRYALRMKDFCNKFFGTVPLRFQGCLWSALQPSDKSVLSIEAQKKHMDWLRRHSDQSVALFGPAGTGKTTWMAAMYAQMCWWETTVDLARTGGLVYRMTTKALLDQFTQYATRGNDYDNPADPPRLSRERIHRLAQRGATVRLFLEEVDKVNQTDSRMANLFEVVDALYEEKGQLVISSNLTLQQFQDQFGEIFVRRIAEMCRMVNLWEAK